MISLPYGEASFRFIHSYHETMDPSALPGTVNIKITRTDSGEELVAETAMTNPQTGVALSYSSITAGDTSVTYTVFGGSDVGVFAEGYIFLLYTTNDNSPSEIVECSHADTTGDILYLTRPTIYTQGTGNISCLTFYYDIDASTVADWPAGMEFQVKCYPDGAATNQGLVSTYLGKVTKTQFVLSGISQKFAAIYPHVYSVIEPRFSQIEEAAYKRLKIYFTTKGRDLDLVADQEIMEPALIEQIYLLGATRSDENEFEITMAKDTLNEHLQRLEDGPFWFDDNQDEIKDETEIGLEPWYPVGRGI